MDKVRFMGDGAYAFHCPGCRHEHVYYTTPPHPNGSAWQFNGNMENPTFTPSLLNRWGTHIPGYVPAGPEYNEGGTCHLFVINGVINYCGDCTHDHNGKQNVAMKEYT